MSTDITRAFGQRVSRLARQQCERLLGTERGQQAAQRVTMAILGAMQAARDPAAFHRASDLSLANCIALSAQTGLLPGGAHPTVYLVPQAARKGAQPSLDWRITHRGIAVLAYRSGFSIRSVPVAGDDFLRVSLGEVVEHVGGVEHWPRTLAEIAGVAVCVRDLERGIDVVRAFVPRAVIEARRGVSRSYRKGFGPWKDWEIEMAQGAAIRYCMARGMVPIDSPELSIALGAERADHSPAREATTSSSPDDALAAVATRSRQIPEQAPQPADELLRERAEPERVAIGQRIEELEDVLGEYCDPDQLAEIRGTSADPDDHERRLCALLERIEAE